MAKKRLVDPEMWTDDKFVPLTPLARLLFIGMWNFACDNGHLDDSPLQLKMRVLPADNCDVVELLDAILATGMVVRADGYLKVVNLAARQSIDMRYLVLCDHCARDTDSRWSEADRKPRDRAHPVPHAGSTRAAREMPKGAPRNGGGGVDGDGDGDRAPKAPSRDKRGTRIPNDFAVTDDMRQWAADQGLAHLDLQAITAEFVDYWVGVAGAKGVKLDWVATWRNRIRLKADDAKVRPIRRDDNADPYANFKTPAQLKAERGF